MCLCGTDVHYSYFVSPDRYQYRLQLSTDSKFCMQLGTPISMPTTRTPFIGRLYFIYQSIGQIISFQMMPPLRSFDDLDGKERGQKKTDDLRAMTTLGPRTLLNGTNSDNIAVSSGVPQGSVLGPILFLAYINDLPEQVRSRVRLFADDTAMYLALDKQADSEILQKDLEILENWEKLWDMSFNPSKCQVIHVTRRKTPLQTKYHLHGCVLESVPSAKYLGVTISEDLKWSEHINNITNKSTASTA